MKNIAIGQTCKVGNGNSFTEDKKNLLVVDRRIRNMAGLTGWNSSVDISDKLVLYFQEL